jgi:hypothetical protein
MFTVHEVSYTLTGHKTWQKESNSFARIQVVQMVIRSFKGYEVLDYKILTIKIRSVNGKTDDYKEILIPPSRKRY